MLRLAAAAILCAAATVCPAQESTWKPPPPPTGWKAVTAKDGAYRFAVPPDTKRSGTREQTLTVNRVRFRGQARTSRRLAAQ